MLSYMEGKMDPTQFGNQYGLSIQHYLVKMIHKILSDTDRETTAVLAIFLDWKDAFPNTSVSKLQPSRDVATY